jgi:hypothetical protein
MRGETARLQIVPSTRISYEDEDIGFTSLIIVKICRQCLQLVFEDKAKEEILIGPSFEQNTLWE